VPTSVKITVGDTIIDNSDFQSYAVDRDMFQPDHAAIVASNQGAQYSTKFKVGDLVEIKVGTKQTSVFQGEVTGLELLIEAGSKRLITIKAMNKFHRLFRGRQSQTFVDKTDQQILEEVIKDASLTLEWKHEASLTYKHVYMNNQSPMEFVRTRATRIGCYVWCVGDTLHVKQPDLQSKAIATFQLNERHGKLREFSPRLLTTTILKKVTVKGWNPEAKEVIIGEALAQDSNSKLGRENAVIGAGPLGQEETFSVDQPIWSPDEAKVLAKAKLQDALLSFITGDAVIEGDPTMDLGTIVEMVNLDPNAKEDPFNGGYYIMGVSHHHETQIAGGRGYRTTLRFARDMQKKDWKAT
jgi:phage protein D